MQTLVRQWQAQADKRSIILGCYLMMTRNILAATEQGEFNDPGWVVYLARRFAAYYFSALDAYDSPTLAAPVPAVWKIAHDTAKNAKLLALQKLLLGVNAHINYDLVFSLEDMLLPEWGWLSETQRAGRYADHCHVNQVIGRTVDAVQDQILEPEMAGLNLVDIMFGRLDEAVIAGLLSRWRENVWQNTVNLLETKQVDERKRLIQHVESHALHQAKLITLENWWSVL